jgi:hypothetical protein
VGFLPLHFLLGAFDIVRLLNVVNQVVSPSKGGFSWTELPSCALRRNLPHDIRPPFVFILVQSVTKLSHYAVVNFEFCRSHFPLSHVHAMAGRASRTMKASDSLSGSKITSGILAIAQFYSSAFGFGTREK